MLKTKWSRFDSSYPPCTPMQCRDNVRIMVTAGRRMWIVKPVWVMRH
jgi:hypothetical protein